jgi:predicted aspartyl protease
MKVTKLIGLLLVVGLVTWSIEVIYLLQQNRSTPVQIKNVETQERNRLELEYRKNERNLEQEYEKKKHLATGETVFDRIFNSPDQNIVDLIKRISGEALPDGWSYNVKVDEFIHFALLVYLPYNSQPITTDQITSYLQPISKYCSLYLSDIALFDRTHKSHLFFDKSILNEIESGKAISKEMLLLAEDQGKSFTRFNSITLKCEKDESHLFLPIEIIGPNGLVTCYALFDTGATTTMISADVISKTGYDNLQIAPRRSFNTANGMMSCPIVFREINIVGFRKNIEVAVNQQDEINLLGMNFFEGINYIVDFQSSAIYVWQK